MLIRKKKMQDAMTYFVTNPDATIGATARMFNVDRGTLRKHLQIMNETTDRRTATVDHSYFKVIDTPEKAYWLGFILADGSLKKLDQVCVALNREDKPHLERLRDTLSPDSNICDYEANNNVTGKKYPTSSLSVTSKQMISDLAVHGVAPNKTKVEQPKLDLRDDLVRHYIRGFFDGDGWISIYDRRPQDRCKNPKTEFGFGSSEDMCEFVSQHLHEVLGIKYKEPKKGYIYRIRYTSNKDIAKIIQYLYHDTVLYLPRKKETADRFCRLYPSLLEG